MPIKFLIYSLLFFIAISANAQNEDVSKLASKQTRDLDEKLILVDPSTALSTEQKKLVQLLFEEKIVKTREIKKSMSQNMQSEIEKLMKGMMQKLHFEILTKKQRLAKFEFQQLYQSK